MQNNGLSVCLPANDENVAFAAPAHEAYPT